MALAGSAAAAAALGLDARLPGDDGVRSLLPPTVANGIAYLFPRWVGPLEGLAALALSVSLPAWLALEYRWSSLVVGVRSPLRFDRK
jgi:hypothetical protein